MNRQVKIVWTSKLLPRRVWGIGLWKFALMNTAIPGYMIQALMQHQAVRLAQQKQEGILSYMWRYLTDVSFRAEVEAKAYAVDLWFGVRSMSEVVDIIRDHSKNRWTVSKCRVRLRHHLSKYEEEFGPARPLHKYLLG